MPEVRLPVELTRSRTGRHAARQIVVIVEGRGRSRVLGRPETLDRGVATYTRGQAGYVLLKGFEGYAVHFRLVRGPGGRISGEIRVYSPDGREFLSMVLRRRKLRRRCGDPGLAWVVEEALRAIGLDSHVRRMNVETGC
ncbi:MAG: hypothetical protein F7C34_03045 [Desulfurococcales archaeon]|nr:hypothetical protein [Desulfurococcales archaeon]